MTNSPEFTHVDFTDVYSRIMQFDKNKNAFVHQWYPFVEGYSKDFILSIIDELDYVPDLALDPFAGSGTTPLELRDLGIRCYSFEISPFMHLLASVKLENSYSPVDLDKYIKKIREDLLGPLKPIRKYISPPLAQTFQPRKGLKKWIFNKGVMNGILDIKYGISLIDDIKYQNLFRIVLASILLKISNAYRDGKSLKYKKNWAEIKIKRRGVHDMFLNQLTETIKPDIGKYSSLIRRVDNKERCLKGDMRQLLQSIPDNSIDLVITSPPYLNSRDYTDIYIAELWVLDLVKNYEELRSLRKSTMRSHVQVNHGELETIDSFRLQEVLRKFNDVNVSHWNKSLSSMIKGYFLDMDTLFFNLARKMIRGKKIFFNVANSAYYGVEIPVDEIVSEIAVNHGFVVNEIRKARDLKPSSQQKHLIKSLRETVIIMTS